MSTTTNFGILVAHLALFITMLNFIHCLNLACNSGQTYSNSANQPIMACTACSSKTCYMHKMPWHEGLPVPDSTNRIKT
ncbi:hypothetical protein BGZ60DRAFT_418504 [Tricladium varicosporioides]|nr:hypothetical protein BGZ60DRAFT_418504 [Hymenoscyphus varicosporioides]